MVMELSLQNEYSLSLSLRVCQLFFRNLMDSHSSGPRSPKKETGKTTQWHFLLEITYWFHAHSIDQSLTIMRINAKILMAKDKDTYCILKVGTNASYEDLLKK